MAEMTPEPPAFRAQIGPVRRPLSSAQIEAVASRSVASFGLLFGAQTFPIMLGQVAQLQTGWFWLYTISIFGGLLAAVAASIVQRYVRAINIYIITVYVLALGTWPMAVVDPTVTASERPWLWFLCTVATAAATIAFSTWAAAGYLVLAPTVYGFVRVSPSGGGASWDLAALDSIYAILLGGAVLMIIALLRAAAAQLDAAQSTALARYAHAVRQHATEIERVQVDSIVHDSVLTTLLSAGRAYSQEAMALAAVMARNAIGHLKELELSPQDDESTVELNEVARRIVGATSTLSAPYSTKLFDVGTGTAPVQAAEALFSAAVQAMVNSLQHAGDADTVTRWLTVTAAENSGIRVEIGDTGVGFDATTLPTERLGLRVSIVERVANAGGRVDLDSAPNEGTVVTITWPQPEGAKERDSLSGTAGGDASADRTPEASEPVADPSAEVTA